MKLIYFNVLIAFCLFSCNRAGSNQDVFSNIDIDDLIEQHPDSALKTLNSLQINITDQRNYNLYILYLIKCKDKLGKDISKDREIIEAYNYFNKNNEDNYAGLSAYYCGRILQKNKEYDDAIKYYNAAERYAEKNEDKDFNGIILYSEGDLMLEQLLVDDAKLRFSEANVLFRQTGNYKQEIKGFSNIALTFLYNSERDSSLVYYDKALQIAKQNNDAAECAYITKDKSVVYYDNNDLKAASKLINEAKSIDSSVIVSGKADFILSNIYFKMNQLDSARYYAKVSLSLINENDAQSASTFSGVYLLLSLIEEQAGNYSGALDLRKSYNDYLSAEFTENNASAIIDIEQKYKNELAHNEINRLSLKELEKQRIIFFLLLVISIITIICYGLILKKNKQLAKANDEILNLTDSIKEFDFTKEELNDTKESIKDYYAHSFNILKRAAALEYLTQDSSNKHGKALIKKFNEIAYGQENIDWDKLYKIINTLNDGFFDKLRNTYLELDEIDFRISCLICSKMNSNEMAVIMQLSVNTIHMRTTNIRKKLGVEKYGNIVDFFIQNIK